MLTAVAAVFAVAISLTGAELLRLRMRWIGWGRRGETIEAFERFCADRGYPAELARATYLHLQRCAGVSGFPVRPHDGLAELYQLDRDDVADLLCVIAMTTECGDVSDERARSLGEVVSAEDAVRVLTPLYAAARRQSSAPLRLVAGGGATRRR